MIVTSLFLCTFIYGIIGIYLIDSHERKNSSDRAFFSVCNYKVLSLEIHHSVQCLTLALSLIETNTKYPILLGILKSVEIEPTYKQLMEKLNIVEYRYEKMMIPEPGRKFHTDQGNPNWIISYSKAYAYLLPYKQVMMLDTDQIIIKNIDHLFDLQKEPLSLSNDCLPHGQFMINNTFVDRKKTSNIFLMYGMIDDNYYSFSLFIIQPDVNIFEKFKSKVDNGTIYHSDGTPMGWKYSTAEITILFEIFGGNFERLSCDYQWFPDACAFGFHPLQYFRLHEAHVIHYTFLSKLKIYQDAESFHYFYHDSKYRGVLTHRHDDEYHERLQCWTHVMHPLHYFHLAIELLMNDSTLSIHSALTSKQSVSQMVKQFVYLKNR